MNKRHLPLAVCALALTLVAPSPTQDRTAQEKTAAQEVVATAVTLKTTDLMVGTGFLNNFDPEAELPDITDEQHYVLVLSTDGKVRHSVADGDPGFVQARVHPAALMELFKGVIDARWQDISGGAIVGMTQIGFTTQNAAKIMNAVRAFPDQIATLDIRLSSNPKTELNRLEISVKVKPTADSWLARLTKELRPHSQGAPMITAKKPLMKGSVAITPSEGLHAVFAPLMEIAAGIGAKNKKDRQTNLDLFTKSMTMLDGTFAVAGDPSGNSGYQGISGVSDAKGYAELLHSDAFEKMMKIVENISPLVEVEFEPVDFKHGEVPVAKSIVTTDVATAGRAAGDQITYAAVAGGYALQATALGKDGITKLIDAAQNQSIKRAPLPNGLLGFMEFRFMDLLDVMSPFGNPLEGDENAPQTMRFEFDTKGSTLNGTIRFK